MILLHRGLIGLPGRVAAHEGHDPGAQLGVEGRQLSRHLVVGEIPDLNGVVGALAGANAAALAGQLIDNGPIVPGDGAVRAEPVAGQAEDAAAAVHRGPPLGRDRLALAQEGLESH